MSISISQFIPPYPSLLGVHWKDWCWSWNFNTLATWCEELTHLKRLWCWEGLGAGEGDDRGWDGWMASPTRWTWVWVDSGSWWWTGSPGVLRLMGSQRVGHDWATELNWPFPPGNHKSLHLWLFLFVSKFICATFLDSTCKQCHMVLVFLWLTSLSMTISSGRCIL